jgi:hypothetical protein
VSILTVAQKYDESLKRLGYKIVAWDGTNARSLYDLKLIIPLDIGNETSMKNGMFLGTSKEFVITYYAESTDLSDLLLTYEYSINDLKKGNPEEEGEVLVSKATLKHVKRL